MRSLSRVTRLITARKTSAGVTDDASMLLGRGRRPVEDELRDLPPLDAGSVRALSGALELEGDAADGDLAETLLTEVTELSAVEDSRRGVVSLRLYLDRVFEVHVEGIAGSVREELGVVRGEDPT